MKPGKPDKPAKPDRSVAGMQVLSDIRGLLSDARDKAAAPEAKPVKPAGADAQTARLQKEIAAYKDQVRRQQEELDRLKTERDGLAARLSAAAPAPEKARQPDRAAQTLSDEVNGLEQRKAELASALADVEGTLLIKTQELLRRLANLYEEAGQADFARELRRGRNGLQDPDNLASFLRAFLRQ